MATNSVMAEIIFSRYEFYYSFGMITLLTTNLNSQEIEAMYALRVISPEFNISHEAHETNPENKFGVTLTLDYKGKQNELVICAAKITMLGIFEKTGEPPISEEGFKQINAPAIIYPFIREHLYNICLKAGIANTLLPTVNFKV